MRLDTVFPNLVSIAVAAPLAFTPVVFGQYEYEPDEGVHEEEWYDPSDWFDAETGAIDYEEMDDEYDYDYTTDDYDFVDDWDSYYDAYYDGYYDGYYDDEFGYDYWDPEWESAFATGYSDGYYDGFYDSEMEYDYEPYYYITSYTIDREDRTREQRRGDETRQRGDRVNGEQRAERRRGDRRMRRDNRERRPERTDMVRRRGTIDSITSIDPPWISEDHHVLKLEFEEGKTVRADFGPKMTKKRLPFSEGDRVTLRGNKKQKDAKSFIVVQKIRSGDKEITLRPGDRQHRRTGDRERSMQQQRRHRITLRGTVSAVDQPDISDEDHTLIRVRMEDGRARVLAFDTDVSRDDLAIGSGDRVRIDGRRMKLHGRTVVDVMSIRVNGERVRISRR